MSRVIHGWVPMEGGPGIPCRDPADETLPHTPHWELVTCVDCLECKNRLHLSAQYRRRHNLQEI